MVPYHHLYRKQSDGMEGTSVLNVANFQVYRPELGVFHGLDILKLSSIVWYLQHHTISLPCYHGSYIKIKASDGMTYNVVRERIRRLKTCVVSSAWCAVGCPLAC
jgi:hypothetical protein